MTNGILFLSSVFMGFIHILTLPYLPTLHSITYGIGVTTSIVNHAYTLPVFKWIDRIWMCIGIIIDSTWCLHNDNNFNLIFVVSYGFLYILAKEFNIRNRIYIANTFHLSTHLLATFLHVIIALNCSSIIKKI